MGILHEKWANAPCEQDMELQHRSGRRSQPLLFFSAGPNQCLVSHSPVEQQLAKSLEPAETEHFSQHGHLGRRDTRRSSKKGEGWNEIDQCSARDIMLIFRKI